MACDLGLRLPKPLSREGTRSGMRLSNMVIPADCEISSNVDISQSIAYRTPADPVIESDTALPPGVVGRTALRIESGLG
jgi:hypothetical protein